MLIYCQLWTRPWVDHDLPLVMYCLWTPAWVGHDLPLLMYCPWTPAWVDHDLRLLMYCPWTPAWVDHDLRCIDEAPAQLFYISLEQGVVGSEQNWMMNLLFWTYCQLGCNLNIRARTLVEAATTTEPSIATSHDEDDQKE
jgi:hypothetical protein